MTTSKQTPPKLAVSIPMAKANATAARLDAIVPNLASDLSPSLVYLPGADNEVVNPGSSLGVNDFGWTAPDLNNGQPYTVQVEVFGAGGGGGGGAATGVGGGGGGGGGEYACEPLYPIIPGETYSYFAGKGGSAGKTSAILNGVTAFPGADGQVTQFDLRGKGLTGGVLANGGNGGDQSGPGVGGSGGTGSANAIHFDGGSGGTSSSGIMSDNPIGTDATSRSHCFGWWRLDDATGATTAQDFSGARKAISVVRAHGSFVAAVKSSTYGFSSPPQEPFGPSQNWWGGSSPGETQGNIYLWDHQFVSGYIGALVSAVKTPSLTTFSASCWIRGHPSATYAGDWGDGTHTAVTLLSGTDISKMGTSKGWALWLFAGVDHCDIHFTMIQSNGVVQDISCTGPSAIDTNWHQVAVTYANGSNNIHVILDGAVVLTTTSTISAISAASEPVQIGGNTATSSYGFKGFMANAWVSSSAYSTAYFAQAFGSAPSTGGSGGGASGGSAGTGNNGLAATSSSGAAAGASAAASMPGINTGSGAGGAGGGAGVAGNNAPAVSPYAGGGGGAGAYSSAVPSAFTLEVPCQMSASYAGLDASGAAAGQLYTVSADPNQNGTDPWYNTAAKNDAICYSGGTSSAPFKGSMNTLLTFPSMANVDAQSGPVTDYLASGDWTVQKTYLKLTVETTGASIIILGSWLSNTVIPALDSDATLGAWGYGGPLLTAYIPAGDAGRQVYIDITGTTIMSTMMATANTNGYTQNGHALQGAGILVGALQGSTLYEGNIHGAWNADDDADWYTAFHGADPDPSVSAALEIYYTSSSSSLLAAGNGADGYIVIRFIDPKGTPVATVLPQAATDASSNALGAGFTADAPNYNVWQPGSNPRTLEIYHPFTPANGWVVANSINCGYTLLPGNMLYINFSVNAGAATNPVIATLPSGWRPNSRHLMPCAPNSASAPVGWCQVDTDGHISVQNGSGNFTYSLSAVIKLDS